MPKRGQVTVFIIIGIILLAIVALFFFLRGEMLTEEIEQEIEYTDTGSVQLFVDGCLDSTLRNAIFQVAQFGGHYPLPELSTQNAYVNTAFYYYLGDLYLPTEQQVADSIANYIDENVVECTNFSYFTGMEITTGTPSTSVILRDESITASLNYPIKIVPKEGLETDISNFEATADTRLFQLYEIAKNITTTQEEFGEMICISCLALLGAQNNLEVLTVDGDEGTLFAIFDLESEIYGPEDEDLSFRIVHKYYDETAYLGSCEDVMVNIDFLRVLNEGDGNSEEEVYVGPTGAWYMGGENIFLTDLSDQLYLDEGLDKSVPGLAMERGEGFLHFILEGGLGGDGIEIMDFTINLDNAIFTSFMNDESYPLENAEDGVIEDSPSQDEIVIEEDGSATAYMRVSSLDDGFYLYYTCEE